MKKIQKIKTNFKIEPKIKPKKKTLHQKVIDLNKDVFTNKQKIKDQYDLEYDMGKKKKLRKKQKRKKLNFNKIWKQKIANN